MDAKLRRTILGLVVIAVCGGLLLWAAGSTLEDAMKSRAAREAPAPAPK